MIAELKPLGRKKLQLAITPRRFLPLDSAIPEERVASGGRRKQAEGCAIGPIRVGSMESEPNPNSRSRVDYQLPTLIDIPELRRRGIVECEHDRTLPLRERVAVIDELRDGDRSEAVIVEQLQISAEVLPLDRPARFVVGDEVILEDRDARRRLKIRARSRPIR